MTDNSLNLSQVIRKRLTDADKRFWAGDNISEFITEKEKDMLVDELTEKFESVLQSLIIDTKNDPNSKGTARRLAKMYVYEIMAGRYEESPSATAFPNDTEGAYEGDRKSTRLNSSH